MPPQFIFMRHGDEEKGLNAPLTELGRHRCFLSAQTLAENFKHISAIYSSPLKRCIETGLAIKEFITYDTLFVSDDLIERQNETVVRPTKTAIVSEWPQLNVSLLTEAHDIWTLTEPLKFVENRVVVFLRNLVKKYESTNDVVLIVTHLDVLFCLFFGISLEYADTMILDCEELKELISYTD